MNIPIQIDAISIVRVAPCASWCFSWFCSSFAACSFFLSGQEKNVGGEGNKKTGMMFE